MFTTKIIALFIWSSTLLELDEYQDTQVSAADLPHNGELP